MVCEDAAVVSDRRSVRLSCRVLKRSYDWRFKIEESCLLPSTAGMPSLVAISSMVGVQYAMDTMFSRQRRTLIFFNGTGNSVSRDQTMANND